MFQMGRPACARPSPVPLGRSGTRRLPTDVIIDLGTEPTTPPKESARPESFKAMQELDLNRGSKDVADYAQRATQGAELGEVELKVKLEEMAADEAGRSRTAPPAGRATARPTTSVAVVHQGAVQRAGAVTPLQRQLPARDRAVGIP